MSVTALEANRLWLALLTQRRKLGLAARQLLNKGGQLALNCVPDLSLEAMLRLSASHGTAFVIVTHDAGLAARAGRVMHLSDGVLHDGATP